MCMACAMQIVMSTGGAATESAVSERRAGERYPADHFAPIAGAVVSTTIESNPR